MIEPLEINFEEIRENKPFFDVPLVSQAIQYVEKNFIDPNNINIIVEHFQRQGIEISEETRKELQTLLREEKIYNYLYLRHIFKNLQIFVVEKENTLSVNGNRLIKYQIFYIKDNCPFLVSPWNFEKAGSTYKFTKREKSERWFCSNYYLQSLISFIYRELNLTETGEDQIRFIKL